MNNFHYFKKFVVILVFQFLLTIISGDRAFAQSIIFQDDFSSDLSKWEPTRDDGSKWFISDGRAGAVVNNNFEVTELVPKINFWDNSLENIRIDFDILPVDGSDINFAMRFNSISDFYEIHFVGGSIFFDRTIPSSSVSYPSALTYGVSSHIRIDYLVDSIKVYVNGVLAAEHQDALNPYESGRIGMKVGTGVAGRTEVYFDNIVVTSLDPNPTTTPVPTASPTPSPVPTPSPSPTPIVTPSPVPTPTPFPYFSQRDPLWGTKDYDSARSWATNGKYLFSDWGCAVTSAAMILRHHGIIQLPSGLGTNPGNLHDWLLSTPNGFVNGGEVNWSKVTKATELMHITHPLWPKLEYKVKNTSDINALAAELSANPKRPAILKVPNLGTHFIVAHNYTSPTNVAIADPAYTSRTTLASYSNSFLSLRTFVPSFTDLSYIMFYSDDKVTPVLEKKVGNSFVPVTDAEVFLEDPLGSVDDGVPASPGKISSLEYAKPSAGEYRLRLIRSEPGISKFTLLTYDVDANEKDLQSSVFFGSAPEFVTVQFSATSSAQTSANRKVGFATLRNELLQAYKLKYFKNGYTGVDLYALLTTSELFYPYSKRTSETAFALYQNTLAKRKLFMTQEFFDVLTADSVLAREQLF